MPGRPYGLDPRTHFWLQDGGGFLSRICDGQQWDNIRGIDNNAFDFCVPCSVCRDIYVDSVANGRGRLQLVDDISNSRVDTLKNGVYSLAEDFITQNKEGLMNSIPMATFARFYAAIPSEQPRIVDEARVQQAAPRQYMSRDFYGYMRNTLRTAHWKTNDISILENDLTPLLDGQKSALKKSHYEEVVSNYASLWKGRDATYFQVPPVTIAIAGLDISVRPEVGMRTDSDQLVLKLWFSKPKPKRAFRQAIQYMMQKAAEEGGTWQQLWGHAIWDVRRKEILPWVRLPRDFTAAIQGQAAAFLHLWRRE